jgi:hypothetical protein
MLGGNIMRAMLRIVGVGNGTTVLQYAVIAWLFAMVALTATYGIGQG